MIPTVKMEKIPVGGVEIPCYYRVQAHSDGDVLVHALIDACLGALALGDIGQWFPDTAKEHQDRKSLEFLRPVLQELKKLGYRVNQMDSTLFLEEPKLAPHSDAIRKTLASALGLELTKVSVKAKTMEGLGPIGERKAISAQVVVLLEECSE